MVASVLRMSSMVSGAEGDTGQARRRRGRRAGARTRLNVAAGAAHAPVRAYALATFLGIMPATFIFSGIGAGLGAVLARGGEPDLHAFAQPAVILPLAALGLLSLGTTLVRGHLTRRRKPL